MELHHKKHHQTYVNGLNDAEKKYAEADLEDRIFLQAALKFNGGGMSTVVYVIFVAVSQIRIGQATSTTQSSGRT